MPAEKRNHAGGQFPKRIKGVLSLSRFYFFISFLILPASAWAVSSVNVPLDSWVYPALETLEGYRLIDSAVAGTKPYSRLEVGRLLDEALKKWEENQTRKALFGFAANDLIPAVLERFKREFKDELADLGALERAKAPSFLKPLDGVILRYQFQSENPIARPQIGNPPSQTIYPIYNNDGIVYRKQHNFTAEVEGEGRLWNHLSLYYRPIFEAFGHEDARVELEKGYLKLEGGNIELEAGRDSMSWGAGHNKLIMTNNARPFDMIKISNPLPFQAPLLGLLKFTTFLTRLDYGKQHNLEPSTVPHPYLWGTRLDFKPHPVFEIGFSRIIMFGGEGREALSFTDYAKILFSRTSESQPKHGQNHQFSFDFAFLWRDFYQIFPISRSLKLYGEWLMDDSTQWAYLAGLLMNDIFLKGRFDFRVEYINTAYHTVPSTTYTHHEYPPIFHDRLFGYYGGGNVEDIFARLNVYLSPKVQMGLDFDLATQGKKLATTTKTYRGGVDLEYWIRDGLSLKGRYILESFRDPNSIARGNHIHHFGGIELQWRL